MYWGADWRSGYGIGFRTKGSLVRAPAGAPFVVALSKSLLSTDKTQEALDGRPTWTDCDEAGDYVVSNVLNPRDLVSRLDPIIVAAILES